MKRMVSFLQRWAVLLVALDASIAIGAVRIMPLGDSITEGCCQTIGGAYRTQLYALLNNAGYTVDFVGTLQDANPPASLPDIDHEGHDGFRIDEIDAGIESWLSVLDDPDVILLHIGTNDAAQNYNFSSAANRLEALIAHLAAERPYAKIIVASLIVAADPTIESRIESFNALVPGVVSHQASLGHQVYFVDMHQCCTVSDLSDQVSGLHPTATGYAKMATNWFPAITSVISPSGTADAPAILGIDGQVDLRHVIVTYSKPVDDVSSTTLGNYSLSGGVSVLQASLDSSKRVVTLTTSVQATSTTYTLTVSGVLDRTSPQHVIASGTTASFQSGGVAEAANYSLVYSLKLPNEADYNSTGVPYDVDNHSNVGSFGRVAYYLELQPSGGAPLEWVWVSMDAFTSDASKIGVPTIQSGGFFQQLLSNLNVHSSVAGVVNGDGLSGGNIEFFWGNYGKSNDAGVPGASSTLYDFGDSAAPTDPAGYGSMQVHNWAAAQTIFAFNGWGLPGEISDLGIGNYSGTYPDWTFAQNATNYLSKTLQVYVLPSSAANRILTVTSANPASGVAVTVSPVDNNGQGNGTTTFTRSYLGANVPTVVSLSAPATAGGNSFLKWQKDGVDAGTSTSVNVTMDANHTMTAVYVTPTALLASSLTVSSANPASGVGVSVSPVDSNGQGNGSTSFTRTYNTGFSWQAEQGNLTSPFHTGTSGAVTYVVQDVGTGPANGGVASFTFTVPVSGTYKVGAVINTPDQDHNSVYVGFENNLPLNDPNNVWDMPVTGGAWQKAYASWRGNGGNTTPQFPLVTWTLAAGQHTLYVVGREPGTQIDQVSVELASAPVVSLTAPATAGGNNFQKWQKDGVDAGTTASVNVTMDANHTMTAVYVTPSPTVFTLSVASSNPASGVGVTVSPNDVNGLGNGTTAFTRSYTPGLTWAASMASLSSPFHLATSSGIQYFVQDIGTGPSSGGIARFTFSVPQSGVYRVAAMINTPDQDHNSVYVGFETNLPLNDPQSVWDMPVTSGQWQKAYASWRGNGGNTTPQFPLVNWQLSAGQHTLYMVGREPGTQITAVYVEPVVTLTAPSTASSHTFKQWQLDGVNQSTSRSVSLSLDGNHTMTAVFQ